jgi:excisionase family DNA binding protein
MRATAQEIESIMSHPTCTVEDAAKVLGIGRGHAYRAIRVGEIRAIHIGKRVLVPTAAIREPIEGTTVPAA